MYIQRIYFYFKKFRLKIFCFLVLLPSAIVSCYPLSADNKKLEPISIPTLLIAKSTPVPTSTRIPTEMPIKDVGIIIKNSKHDEIRFDYYSYIPHTIKRADTIFIVINGFQCCCTEEEQSGSNKGWISNYTSYLEEYKFALLSPVIEKNCGKDVDDWVYHFPEYVFIDEGNRFYRFDEQINLMIEEFIAKLENEGLNVYPKVMPFGFSIDALFANRYAILHPEKVLAIAAGGSAGEIIIPEDSIKNHPLSWPYGVNNFYELSKENFDFDNYLNVKQFHFWGSDDLEFYHLEGSCRAGYSDACYWKKYWGETLIGALDKQTEYLINLGCDIKTKEYLGIGHDFTEEMKDDVFIYFDEIRNSVLTN